MKTSEHTIQRRAAHHAALLSLYKGDKPTTGLKHWVSVLVSFLRVEGDGPHGLPL